MVNKFGKNKKYLYKSELLSKCLIEKDCFLYNYLEEKSKKKFYDLKELKN